ncbi:MAG TPA: sigma-70 family RNA polymerase sigma factor [Gaiellaceae bacterium]|nr:sigma-70 family RNA polymerase sigma factor [Gaiellaceae bacterium]
MRPTHSQQTRRFDALFAAHGADVLAYCTWRAASASDGQDAAADVFLTAWRRLDAVPEGASARLWLYATARRVIANQRRARRRGLALQERLASEAGAGPAVASSQDDEQDARVHEALRSLSSRDREVLLLSEWESLSPAEIASVIGCLTVTARGRLHRARHRFRTAFEELPARDGSAPATTDVFRRRIHEHA